MNLVDAFTEGHFVIDLRRVVIDRPFTERARVPVKMSRWSITEGRDHLRREATIYGGRNEDEFERQDEYDQ